MFTGIITDIASVLSLDKQGDTRIRLRTVYDTASIAIGASIACDGCCLTVVELGQDWFEVEASAETLSRTTLGTWKAGNRVNLERALKVGDELGGHFVSGHVDGVATLETLTAAGDSKVMEFSVRHPGAGRDLAPYIAGDPGLRGDDANLLSRFIAEKGSVTLNGVSLTVNAISGDHFSVNIIPHTLAATNLGLLKPGDPVNLEIDLLARYLARLNEKTI